jgi:hypothetical protein
VVRDSPVYQSVIVPLDSQWSGGVFFFFFEREGIYIVTTHLHCSGGAGFVGLSVPRDGVCVGYGVPSCRVRQIRWSNQLCFVGMYVQSAYEESLRLTFLVLAIVCSLLSVLSLVLLLFYSPSTLLYSLSHYSLFSLNGDVEKETRGRGTRRTQTP